MPVPLPTDNPHDLTDLTDIDAFVTWVKEALDAGWSVTRITAAAKDVGWLDLDVTNAIQAAPDYDVNGPPTKFTVM
jgi:hypothetical protein